jgi:glycosyltransferase involved in cell wall biosynthesis
MHILYDHQIFNRQIFGGISRYYYELLNDLSHRDDIQIDLALKYSNNYYIQNAEFSYSRPFSKDKYFTGKGSILKILYYLNKQNSIRTLKQNKFSIFHPTYFDPYFLPYLNKKPFVLTIYDLTHEKFPDSFSNTTEISQNRKLLAQKANNIIAISESTKKDIVELYGISEEKVDVIYLGNSLDVSNTKASKLKPPEKYILFIGDRLIYKNFIYFLDSIADILLKDKDLSLVCSGSSSFSSNELEFFKEKKLSDKIFHFKASEADLIHLYKNALCFVFPSLSEGFGIPVLEAFACGCPLAVSNVSSLPEVAGEGAVYFDPSNSNSINSAVSELINSSTLRENVVQKGYIQLEKFSWKRTATETLQLYNKIV